ncbi:MAG: hypothetical protein UX19_C0005G0006 [Candidatus Woesebacteria bacterium GW2011_GWA1_45_8]|uniref:Uncharacterized protein n=1 Tax=Candidatus Woesebacteria bacterium GW2011_GWA1_45_8 TaxID=1618559 RepID=A0A0G1MVB1_9BACT|nr:MAG: hypothetical protein UX19_C0005G0006 [Candidatus Woesebacteria bacterium GW2011_GWA1_45_8]
MLDLGITIWPVVKFFVIIALAIYAIFAGVVLKQIKMMTDTIEVGFEAPVRFIGLAHFLFAVAVLIFALIIL